MSVAVNESTRVAAEGGPLSSTPTTIGVVVLGALVLVLIGREVLRIAGAPGWNAQLRYLDLVAVPLLAAALAVLGLRFLTILGTL